MKVAGTKLVATLGEVYTEQSGKTFEDYFRLAVIALVKANGYARFDSAQVRFQPATIMFSFLNPLCLYCMIGSVLPRAVRRVAVGMSAPPSNRH